MSRNQAVHLISWPSRNAFAFQYLEDYATFLQPTAYEGICSIVDYPSVQFQPRIQIRVVEERPSKAVGRINFSFVKVTELHYGLVSAEK